MSSAVRSASVILLLRTTAAALALCAAAGAARGADLAAPDGGPLAMPNSGGGYWAPRVPVRPPPVRYDIYGYPILGPGLIGLPAPHAIGVGCPPALQPAYDPDGNLAGYAPLQYCR